MSNTIESIEQGNKLIAFFMDAEWKEDDFGMYEFCYKHFPTKHSGKWWDLKGLQYQESWDWLMPVVEKIETLVIKTNITSNCVIIRVNEDELNTDDVVVSYKGIMSKIEAVWQAVVQFIEWYNNQKVNQ